MIPYIRYRRENIRDLQIGQLIRSNILFQSKTGMIVRVKLRGRIESIHSDAEAPSQDPHFVEGLLRGKHGIVQPFKLTDQERVYRKREKHDLRKVGVAEPAGNKDEKSRDSERAT